MRKFTVLRLIYLTHQIRRFAKLLCNHKESYPFNHTGHITKVCSTCGKTGV